MRDLNTPWQLLTEGGGVQMEFFFRRNSITVYNYATQYPEPPKTALKCGNAHKLSSISFLIYYTKITTFPAFGNFFLLFYGGVGTPFPRVQEVWVLRSHAFP